MMKRTAYITLFVILGNLISWFVHGSLEIAYSILLWRDFATWSFGLTYDTLWNIHHVIAVLLFVAGVWYGFRAGKFWWAYLYQENGELKPEFRHRYWKKQAHE